MSMTEVEILEALANGPLSVTEIACRTASNEGEVHLFIGPMLDKGLVWPLRRPIGVLRMITRDGRQRLREYREKVEAIKPDSFKGRMLLAILVLGQEMREAPCTWDLASRLCAFQPEVDETGASLESAGLVKSRRPHGLVLVWTLTSMGRSCAERLQQ
jgi:hypothetical protein